MEEIKIIFLDIDGVLNVISQGRDKYGSTFHQHFIVNLKRLIDETGAKIVITSSWRKEGLDVMQNMWKDRGYAGEIIDVTPTLRLRKGGTIQFWNDKMDRKPTEKIHGYSIPRGSEIDYWLRNESERFGKVISYVIIDDDDDFLFSQKDNYVQCKNNISHSDCIDIGYGLTSINTDLSIKILNDVPFKKTFSMEYPLLDTTDPVYLVLKEWADLINKQEDKQDVWTTLSSLPQYQFKNLQIVSSPFEEDVDTIENPDSRRKMVITCLDQLDDKNVPVTMDGKLSTVHWIEIGRYCDIKYKYGTWSDKGFSLSKLMEKTGMVG